MRIVKIFNAVAISKNGNTTSKSIDLRSIANNGMFSIHYTFTSGGAATLKLEYLLAHEENETYATPSAANDIVSAAAVGADIVSFSPLLAPLMKIKATENNVAAITALTAYLCIQ